VLNQPSVGPEDRFTIGIDYGTLSGRAVVVRARIRDVVRVLAAGCAGEVV